MQTKRGSILVMIMYFNNLRTSDHFRETKNHIENKEGKLLVRWSHNYHYSEPTEYEGDNVQEAYFLEEEGFAEGQ